MPDHTNGAAGAVSTTARTIAAVLDVHGVAAVAWRDGAVAWANETARSLVDPVDADGARVSIPDVDRDARVLAAFRVPEPLGPAIDAAVAGDGAFRVEFAANHALIVAEASVEQVDDLDDAVALVSFRGSPSRADADRQIERLEAMLDATADIITVLDREGRVRYSNGAAGRVTGLSGLEANGASMFDFIHPDDADIAAEAYMRGVVAGEPIAPVELRLRFADGEWHDVEAEITSPVNVDGTEGYVVTIRDITERVHRERELDASHRRLQSLVEDIDDVVVVLGQDLSVSYTSPGIERIIDAPAYTNVGESAFNDMHPDDVAGVLATLEEVSQSPGRRGRASLRLQHERFGWRWIDASVVNRLDDPAVRGFVCTLRDVTQQRDADAELKRLREQDREEMARLREADRLKDDFLTTVSHELRTPLTSVRGFSALLQSQGSELDPATRDQLIDRIAANAVEMEDMVEQLLDFSRLQADRVRVEVAPLDIRDRMGELLARLEHQLAEHEIAVDVPPMRAWADGRAFDHVLRNLLTNAARYSSAGSRIDVRAVRRDAEIDIEVQDRGIGIDPEQQGKIFRSFYQATPGATGRRGVGVGLNIARRYAQLQSGHLRVESTPGIGSTFTLTLQAAD